jgi:hypothetical protein
VVERSNPSTVAGAGRAGAQPARDAGEIARLFFLIAEISVNARNARQVRRCDTAVRLKSVTDQCAFRTGRDDRPPTTEAASDVGSGAEGCQPTDEEVLGGEAGGRKHLRTVIS